jgi:hypothetical protein
VSECHAVAYLDIHYSFYANTLSSLLPNGSGGVRGRVVCGILHKPLVRHKMYITTAISFWDHQSTNYGGKQNLMKHYLPGPAETHEATEWQYRLVRK